MSAAVARPAAQKNRRSTANVGTRIFSGISAPDFPGLRCARESQDHVAEPSRSTRPLKKPGSILCVLYTITGSGVEPSQDFISRQRVRRDVFKPGRGKSSSLGQCEIFCQCTAGARISIGLLERRAENRKQENEQREGTDPRYKIRKSKPFPRPQNTAHLFQKSTSAGKVKDAFHRQNSVERLTVKRKFTGIRGNKSYRVSGFGLDLRARTIELA